MPTIETSQFGPIEFSENAVFEFPGGLPGFEQARRYVCIERQALRPIVFLQNVEDPGVCFITLPAKAVDPDYDLSLANEELAALGMSNMQESLACLAIVCMPQDSPPTANLLGPVVLSRETMRGVQAIREDNRYSAVHPLKTGREQPAMKATAASGENEC